MTRREAVRWGATLALVALFVGCDDGGGDEVGGAGGGGGSVAGGGAGGEGGAGGLVADERGGLVFANDGHGDGATRLVYLDQGWNPAETRWYYHADQGSVLIPRRVFLNLEQPDAPEKFLAPDHVNRLRFLPQTATPDNPDALPVGFAVHEDRIGLTCAACHTAQLDYNGVAMRIEGGQALIDLDGFLEDVERSLANTLADEDKRARYLDALSDGPPPVREMQRAVALTELEEVLAEFQSYNDANESDVAGGFGRMDAVGRIVNQVIRMTSGPENSVEPNAPNSLPVLWDGPRHDYVQWSGFGTNADGNALARNAGEVIGVFGQVEVVAYQDENQAMGPYRSTIHGHNLVALEAQLWNLQSPAWPEDILPPIDRALSERGAEIYQAECVDCHAIIRRDDEDRRVRAQMYGIDVIGTDPKAASNFANGFAPTGVLEGSVNLRGETFGAMASARELLATLVLRALFGQPASLAETRAYAQRYGLVEQEKQGDYPQDTEETPAASLLAYKARPLNGIWASAPYLHNGSVPTLYDLLLPPDQRPVTFGAGRRTFDPVKVGPTQEGELPFVVDTRIPGNANTGHEQGTRLPEEDRQALVEYLKTL